MFETILVVFAVHCNFRMKIGFYSNIVKKIHLFSTLHLGSFLTVIFKLTPNTGTFNSENIQIGVTIGEKRILKSTIFLVLIIGITEC